MKYLTTLVVLFVVVLNVTSQRSRPPECLLPRESGVCMAYFPRYYYNSGSGHCEKFVYGGCGGNRNSFLTEAECQNHCSVD